MREDGQRTVFTLGSVAQTGSLLLFDDLEGPFKWKVVSGWPTGRGFKSTYAKYDGSYGLGLQNRMLSPDGPARAFRGRSFGYRSFGRWSVECVFEGYFGFMADLYFVLFEVVKGGRLYSAGVLYDAMYTQWGVEDGKDSWVLVSEATVALNTIVWHRISLEVDFSIGEYIAFEIDAERFDLSGRSIGDQAGAGGDVARVICGMGFYTVGTKGAHFDNVLVREI